VRIIPAGLVSRNVARCLVRNATKRIRRAAPPALSAIESIETWTESDVTRNRPRQYATGFAAHRIALNDRSGTVQDRKCSCSSRYHQIQALDPHSESMLTAYIP